MTTSVSSPASGSAILTDGRTPLILEHPNALLRVNKGQVNLFVELLDDQQAVLQRQFLCNAQANDSIPLPSDYPPSLRLVVVGVGPAEVSLFDRGDSGLAGDNGFDRAFDVISKFANDSALLPSSWSVLPGTREAITGPQLLTAHELAWVQLRSDTDNAESAKAAGGTEETSHRKTTDEERASASIHPVSTVLSLQVEAGMRIEVMNSAEAIAQFGFSIVAPWMNQFFARIAELLQRSIENEKVRNLQRRENEAELISSTFGHLSSIMGESDTGGARAGSDPRSAVRDAIVELCDAEGIEIDLARLDLHDEAGDADFQQYLRQLGLRSRRVELQDRWWQQDSASCIGFTREDQSPVAIIRRKPARYTMTDPASGRPATVNAARASSLSESAYILYRPLPYHALTAIDLIRHVFQSPARQDMKWAGGLALAIALLGLLTPVLTGRIFNEVIPYAETERLLHFGLGLVVMALGTAIFHAIRAVALLRVESFADGTLQAAVWDRLLRLPLTFFRRYQVGDLMIKAMGPTQLRKALSDTALSSMLAAVFSLVNFALMLTYDSRLALVALLFSLASGAVLFALSYLQLRLERSQLKSEGDVSSFVLQILFGINKIRLAGAENRSYALWLKKFADHRLRTFKAENIANLSGTLNQVLPLLASILFYTTVGLAEGGISVGNYLAFSAAFGMFQGAMLTFVASLSTSLGAIPIYENMKPLLEELPETAPDQKAPGKLSGLIELNNVNFRYEEDGPLILDKLSLKLEPGKFVAIVGPSGSGKSTIFRLLLGFEKPASGAVSFDGNNLSELDLRQVRRQMGVVLQRGAILPGSLYENIVGSSPISMEGAWEAARMAGFDKEIEEMPMGMHTVLSQGGGALSGGQRQRLMIARAIVSRPRILLMDEATSALDNRTQSIVSEALKHLNATRVVIAHRLSTVIDADCIYVVDAGRVVQAGSYEELLNTEGVFQTIARPQLQ